jgi:hypothetical protein
VKKEARRIRESTRRWQAADLGLKLAGYEVFRFGASELQIDAVPRLKDFFNRLFDRFKVRSPV